MKKALSFLLAICLLLSVFSTSAYASIHTDKISRIDFCRIADKMLVDTGMIDESQNYSEPFKDTDDDSVARLYSLKVINGTSEDTFSPSGLITREEAATLIDRIYAIKSTEDKNDIKSDSFEDAKSISSWALESVERMNRIGIFIGMPNGYFQPKDNITFEQSKLALLRLQEFCDPDAISSLSIEKTLNEITMSSRKIGTVGAEKAEEYIFDKLKSYGYETEKQNFEFTDKEALEGEQISNIGTNIIAVKKATVDNPDIIVVSAHYDTVSGIVGANDDGSGVALLLEMAKAVSDIKSDTEIRFIAFSGEEEGLLGSSYYVNNLSSEEKQHIMGDIQLDMLGHYMSNAFNIYTTDGNKTLVGNIINEKAKEVTGNYFEEKVEAASDHMSFVREGIPAILISQNNIGVENHNVSDNMSIIDCDKIEAFSDVFYEALLEVMSEETTNLTNKAYDISEMKDPSYTIGDETIFYFGERKMLNDGKVGGPGKLIAQKHDDEIDWDYEYYYYNAKWFDMDKSLPTVFEYRLLGTKRYLLNIDIDFVKAGYSEEQIKNILEDKYGEPEYEVENDNGSYDFIWVDELHSKQYILTDKENKRVIEVSSSYQGSGEVIEEYDLTDGIEKYKDVDKLHYRLLDFTEKLTSNYESYIDTLSVWTDGLSYQLGAIYPTVEGDNSKYTLRIDITDVFDKNGNFRDEDKTLATFVHEFGHVLTLNNTQVDNSKKDPNKYYATYDSFMEGSYIKAFYDEFWKPYGTDTGSELYKEKPEMFVDEYASTNSSEDIAESFMLFVLSNKPAGNTIAEQKIKFFYDYPELVELRDNIRLNFGYGVK